MGSIARIIYKPGDYILFKRIVAGDSHWFLGYVYSINTSVPENTSKQVISNTVKAHKYYKVIYLDDKAYKMNIPQHSNDYIYIETSYKIELEFLRPFILQENSRVHDIDLNYTFTVKDVTYSTIDGLTYVNFLKNDKGVIGTVLDTVLNDDEYLIL